MNRANQSGFRLAEAVVAVLALAGFVLNGMLLVWRYGGAGASTAGCGGGPCDEVLFSRWSVLLGMPVPLFGLVAYGSLVLSLVPRFGRLRVPVIGLIAGAALWFVGVQALILGKFCLWCMSVHAVAAGLFFWVVWRLGLSGFRRILPWCLAAVVGIALPQQLLPAPAMHQLEGQTGEASQGNDGTADDGSRRIFFDGGRISLKVSEFPLLGKPDARHVMVEYFDYQCGACRMMAGFLEALVEKHPDEVAVLLLPVPLDEACNAWVPEGAAKPGSCEIAKTALAVWRAKPNVFPAFHRKVLANPAMAGELAAQAGVVSQSGDPWIERALASNIGHWREFGRTNPKLPKLLIRDRRILHGLPSGEAEFIRVMESELGL